VSRNPDVARIVPDVVPDVVNFATDESIADFAIVLADVPRLTQVTIEARLGGTADPIEASLTVTPSGTPSLPLITGVTLAPAGVTGGQPVEGRVTLSAPAPAEGVLVALASSDSGVAAVEKDVTVPAGETAVSFAVQTQPVVTRLQITISASLERGVPQSAVLTVVPRPGRAWIGVFRPSTREWFLRSADAQPVRVQFGGPGDSPVPADYLGTGKVQFAVFRPSTLQWFVRTVNGGTAEPIQFGGPGDLPVPADYLAFPGTEVAVFRPGSPSLWFTRENANGQTVGPISFGGPNDIPMPADYLGTGHAQIAVFRPGQSGVDAQWFIRDGAGNTVGPIPFGGPGDVPVPANYLDGSDVEIAIYRPSTSQWFIRGRAEGPIQFGGPGDIPIPADYLGTGRAQIAVFRPGTQQWFIRPESGSSAIVVQWGGPGDVPVPAAYDVPGGS
jgi:hypothetical protein